VGEGEGTRTPFCVRGATVIDGTGADPTIANVLVDARGTITSVGTGAPATGMAIVEGAGLVLAPGFIDLHSHSDLYTVVPPKPQPSSAGRDDSVRSGPVYRPISCCSIR